MREPGSLDVSALPTFAFGHRSLMWWGTFGLIVIESMIFALTVASYFYLRSHSSEWPMNAAPPDLLWGTLNTVLLVLSMLPNYLAKKAAEKLDLRPVRIWMVVSFVFAVAILAVRVFEFPALNTRWDSQAYGSVLWMLMGLHTTHLITDAYDTLVLTVLTFTGPPEGKRFGDVSENAMYWFFVVLSWLPIYAVAYWAPRF
jgi:heme/copper-type cytochrome/quinol oxidase subunit 3